MATPLHSVGSIEAGGVLEAPPVPPPLIPAPEPGPAAFEGAPAPPLPSPPLPAAAPDERPAAAGLAPPPLPAAAPESLLGLPPFPPELDPAAVCSDGAEDSEPHAFAASIAIAQKKFE
ncbi:MAG TPA: hypothetical protein VJV78_20210 [Polyangiales bacterium]|nr:hypothetical protein [Polyangiales bacterium]